MAQNKNIEVGLAIAANVEGAQAIERLTDSIKAAGGETGELAVKATQLHQAWREAQQNTALIEHYKSLKNALHENRLEISQTEQTQRQLKAAMADGGNKKQQQEYDELTLKLQRLNQARRQLQNILRQTGNEMNAAGIAVKNLAQQEQHFAQQSRQAEQELGKLNHQAAKMQQLAQAKTTLGLDINAQSLDDIQRINQAFLTLKRDGKLSQAELAQAAQAHQTKLLEIEKSLKRSQVGFADIQNTVQSMGAATGLAYLAKEAMSFETAMAGVKKVTNASDEDLAQLSDSLKQLAGELGLLPDELANIAAQGGQMGIAFEKLPEFTRLAATMSNAFNMTSEEAGDAAAKIANIYSLGLEEMRAFGDAVNALGNTTAAKEAEIVEVMKRIGGNSKQFGLAADQAAALGATLISLGKSPEVAGTAINALLSKLQNSKNGTAEFQAALKDLGYSTEEMAAQIAANPQAALSNFLSKLEQLDKQTRSEMLGQMFGAEYADDIAVLTGSLKTYEDALTTLADKEAVHGAMQREAAAALETTEGKIKTAKAAFAATAATLGDALLPVIAQLAQALGGVANAVSFVAQEFPVLTQFAMLFAAAKVSVLALNSVLKLTGKDGLSSLLSAGKGASSLGLSLKTATQEARLLNNELAKGAKINPQAGISNIGKLGNALNGLSNQVGMLTAAGMAGFGFGDAIYKESEAVRWLGDRLGGLGAAIHSLATTGSLQQYNEHFRTSAQLAREQAEAEKKAAQAAAEKAAAAKQAAAQQVQAIETLRQKRVELNEQIAANERSLNVLNQAGNANGATAAMLVQQNEALRAKLSEVNAELGKQNAQIGDASPLFKQRQALEALGLTAEQVASGISKNAQEGLNNFHLAATQFGVDADSMGRMFQAALQKMDSPEAAAKLKQSLYEVGQQAGLTEAQIRSIAAAAPDVADEIATAFDKIGVDTQAVMGGVSAAAQQAMADFQAASDTAREQGVQDARLIAAGFEAMLGKLQSPEEFSAFKKQLTDSGDAAKLTQEQLERLNQAAEKGAIAAKTAYEQLSGSLKNAVDTAQIQAAGQAAEAAMKRGEISAAQYQEVLAQVKTRTDELAQSSSKAGAAQEKAHQSAAQAVKQSAIAQQTAKNATEQSTAAQEKQTAATERGTNALREQSRTFDEFSRHIGNHYRQMQQVGQYDIGDLMAQVARQQSGAWANYVQTMQQLRGETAKIMHELNNSFANGSQLAHNLARAENLAINNAQKLDKTTLNNLQAAIDKAREKVQAFSDEAAQAARDAQRELLQAQGKDEELAQLEQQQKIAALQQKLNEAGNQGNSQASADWQRAIAATQQAFAEKQRRERQAAEQARLEEEQRQREQAEREAEQAKQAAEQSPLKLPEPPAINIGNLDLSHLGSALSERDKQLVEQVKQAIMSELVQQMKNRSP